MLSKSYFFTYIVGVWKDIVCLAVQSLCTLKYFRIFKFIYLTINKYNFKNLFFFKYNILIFIYLFKFNGLKIPIKCIII